MLPAMEHSIALQQSINPKHIIVNLYSLATHISATYARKQEKMFTSRGVLLSVESSTASYIFQFSPQHDPHYYL